MLSPWVIKAIAKQVLSRIPCGADIDGLIQTRVTKSLPCNQASFDNSVNVARRHIEMFERYGRAVVKDARFYEFGAGWDLIGPLTFFQLGVGQQTLSDIRRNVKVDLINDTRARLEIPDRIASVEELSKFGIAYKVGLPVDMKDRFDCIVSTSTLEHIPAKDIPTLLETCRDLLTEGGIISFSIDCRDHYCDSDSSISPYNFLRYSATTWRLFNPPLHYQNRLRVSDYVEMFKAAGLKIIHQKSNHPKADHIDSHPQFSRYSSDDLLAPGLSIVARY